MNNIALATLIAATGFAAQANGQVIASFSYENLDSDFDINSSTLTTSSSLLSTGSFSDLEAPATDAIFGSGSADFALSMSVSSITASGAAGSGSLVLTDLDGDTMTADVAGLFSIIPIGTTGLVNLTYSGVLSNVFFNDTGLGGDSFDGSFGSADTSFSASEPYEGALVQLTIAEVNVFQTSWFDKLSEVDGQIVVPTPASAALLGLGGLVATRRRR